MTSKRTGTTTKRHRSTAKRNTWTQGYKMTEKDHMKTQNHHLVQKDMQHIHKAKHKKTQTQMT